MFRGLEEIQLKSNLPKYQSNSPIAPCPYCTEGVVRYKYTWDEKENLIEYAECSEVMCGFMVEGEQLEAVLNSQMAIYLEEEHAMRVY